MHVFSYYGKNEITNYQIISFGYCMIRHGGFNVLKHLLLHFEKGVVQRKGEGDLENGPTVTPILNN